MEYVYCLQSLQDSATGSYPKAFESSPNPLILLFKVQLMTFYFESQPEGRLHRMRISVVFLVSSSKLPECSPRLATTVPFTHPHRAFPTAIIYIFFQLNAHKQLKMFLFKCFGAHCAILRETSYYFSKSSDIVRLL